MKNVLVVYYTQTGQLKSIVDSVTTCLVNDNNTELDYLNIKPKEGYPYPWGKQFFDIFPETVKGISCELQPIKEESYNKDYDLIILAYQPWFLSPSIPIWSFLESKEASALLKDKKVVTLIGARNMWAGAQELIKKKLADLGANLSGNIVLQDRTDNIVAAITIIRWLVHGKKGPTSLLPEAGVSKNDIINSAMFGETILGTLRNNEYDSLQNRLLKQGAVKVKYHLLNIEITARKIFCKFADLALKKGMKSGNEKKRIIRMFKGYLLFALFIISPFVSLIFMVKRVVIFPLANKKINYYSDVKLNL